MTEQAYTDELNRIRLERERQLLEADKLANEEARERIAQLKASRFFVASEATRPVEDRIQGLECWIAAYKAQRPVVETNRKEFVNLYLDGNPTAKVRLYVELGRMDEWLAKNEAEYNYASGLLDTLKNKLVQLKTKEA